MTIAGRSCVAVLAVIGVIALTLGAAPDPIEVALNQNRSSPGSAGEAAKV